MSRFFPIAAVQTTLVGSVRLVDDRLIAETQSLILGSLLLLGLVVLLIT